MLGFAVPRCLGAPPGVSSAFSLLRPEMVRALVLVSALLVPLLATADALPAVERTKIEALITFVEKLPDASFVRNGKSYDAKTAAKFLRGKWRDRADEVRSAEEFIQRVATKSSTSGKPYLVRYRDGREVAAAALLREELRRLATKQ